MNKQIALVPKLRARSRKTKKEKGSTSAFCTTSKVEEAAYWKRTSMSHTKFSDFLSSIDLARFSQIESRSFESAQGEFFDANDEFSSSSSSGYFTNRWRSFFDGNAPPIPNYFGRFTNKGFTTLSDFFLATAAGNFVPFFGSTPTGALNTEFSWAPMPDRLSPPHPRFFLPLAPIPLLPLVNFVNC
ncbi:unnamed protein product [Fraxinus pennsylvanica]|uniref:Uncharacterized protein n=1 Tax=Fraxinus pennsylvanica TaxID=56036 RepID=A0AAD1ZSR1_9LAMI|nr:unnamed protein product [Fraxinus pennsylvanica]